MQSSWDHWQSWEGTILEQHQNSRWPQQSSPPECKAYGRSFLPRTSVAVFKTITGLLRVSPQKSLQHPTCCLPRSSGATAPTCASPSCRSPSSSSELLMSQLQKDPATVFSGTASPASSTKSSTCSRQWKPTPRKKNKKWRVKIGLLTGLVRLDYTRSKARQCYLDLQGRSKGPQQHRNLEKGLALVVGARVWDFTPYLWHFDCPEMSAGPCTLAALNLSPLAQLLKFSPLAF